jgi:hypothetical protein
MHIYDVAEHIQVTKIADRCIVLYASVYPPPSSSARVTDCTVPRRRKEHDEDIQKRKAANNGKEFWCVLLRRGLKLPVIFF